MPCHAMFAPYPILKIKIKREQKIKNYFLCFLPLPTFLPILVLLLHVLGGEKCVKIQSRISCTSKLRRETDSIKSEDLGL